MRPRTCTARINSYTFPCTRNNNTTNMTIGEPKTLSRETRSFIVSNVAIWAPSVKNADYDGPHKWTISLRGSEEEIQRVIFRLPISYRPNAIEIRQPPFQITKRSWAQFPVRCHIFFKNPQNRSFEITHNIQVDTCFSRKEMQSTETIVTTSIYVGNNEQTKSAVPQYREIKCFRTLAQEQEELLKLMNSMDFTKSIFKIMSKQSPEKKMDKDYIDEITRVQLFKEYCPPLLDHTYAKWTIETLISN